MNLSISCDHRVVDGWDAASFVQDAQEACSRPRYCCSPTGEGRWPATRGSTTTIARAAPISARPILEHRRELVHRDRSPTPDEAIKWGMPHFIYKGKNLGRDGRVQGAYCVFMIHGDGRHGGDRGDRGSLGKLATRSPTCRRRRNG